MLSSVQRTNPTGAPNTKEKHASAQSSPLRLHRAENTDKTTQANLSSQFAVNTTCTLKQKRPASYPPFASMPSNEEKEPRLLFASIFDPFVKDSFLYSFSFFGEGFFAVFFAGAFSPSTWRQPFSARPSPLFPRLLSLCRGS